MASGVVGVHGWVAEREEVEIQICLAASETA
jgi:hypothetical protein